MQGERRGAGRRAPGVLWGLLYFCWWIGASRADVRNWRFCLRRSYSGRRDDDKAFRTSHRNGHHDNGRSSIQSTYNRRSEKSHAPSIFTNVSW